MISKISQILAVTGAALFAMFGHNILDWLDLTHEWSRLSGIWLIGIGTDKKTDESWDIFIVWKINSGLWAGLDREKKMFGPIMSNFWGPFFKVFMGKN